LIEKLANGSWQLATTKAKGCVRSQVKPDVPYDVLIDMSWQLAMSSWQGNIITIGCHPSKNRTSFVVIDYHCLYSQKS
jgi:hypothetical protein